ARTRRCGSMSYPSPAPRSSWSFTQSCCGWCCPATSARASGSSPSRWAAPAASTGAWPSPPSWRPGSRRCWPLRAERTYRQCTGIWVGSKQLGTGPRAVALGGGHGLAAALWALLDDAVAGLEWVGRLLGTGGRVLPMAAVPLDIVAEVVGADPDRPEEVSTVRGQAECASTPGQVRSITLLPPDPPAVPEA